MDIINPNKRHTRPPANPLAGNRKTGEWYPILGRRLREPPDSRRAGKQGSTSFLRFILRNKPRRTRGWLITGVLRDIPLENAINMVIPHDMFLPVGTVL